MEQSALNALYGSVNLYHQSATLPKTGETMPPLPFDSYSPLVRNCRGRGVGGLKYFDDGTFYGCCAAIGAAGIGLWPLIRQLRKAPPFSPVLRERRLNGCVAFTWGPYVLARDAAKEDADITRPVRPKKQDGALCYTLLPCAQGETVRLRLQTQDGAVLLTDYASCGKRWADTDAPFSVWLPVTS